MSDSLLQLLIRNLDQAFNKRSWHGPNLRGSIRGLTLDQAGWRPQPDRHSIAEIVLHTAYWKYTVRRRLQGGKRGSFHLKGSNWFPQPEPFTEEAWLNFVHMLEDEHKALVVAVSGLHDSDLEQCLPGSKVTPELIITGIAAHDVYHAGQIQLLKRMQGGE